MMKYLMISLGLFILTSMQSYSRQVSKGTTLFLADGKIAHLVPTSVVRKTMDVTLSIPDDEVELSTAYSRGNLRYVIQVGTFAVKENAFRLDRRLKQEGYVVKVWQYVSKGERLYYVVTAGDYATVDDARQRLGAINDEFRVEALVLAQGRARE